MKAMPLSILRVPFDDPDWLYEIKCDGFRAERTEFPATEADNSTSIYHAVICATQLFHTSLRKAWGPYCAM